MGIALGGLGVVAVSAVIRHQVPEIGAPLPLLLLVAWRRDPADGHLGRGCAGASRRRRQSHRSASSGIARLLAKAEPGNSPLTNVVKGEYLRCARKYSPLAPRPHGHAAPHRSDPPGKSDHGDPLPAPARDRRRHPRRAAGRVESVQRAQAARHHDRTRPAGPRGTTARATSTIRPRRSRKPAARRCSSWCGLSSTTRRDRPWRRCWTCRRRR